MPAPTSPAPWPRERTLALPTDASVVTALAAVDLTPSCGHADACFTAARVPLGGGTATILCEACYSTHRESDRAARIASTPVITSPCELCTRTASPVRHNSDLALAVCDACIHAQHAAVVAADASRVPPLDVVPDEVVPGLFISAKEGAANAATLARLAITRVLVCCDSLRAYHTPSPALRYHRVVLADSLAQSLADHLPPALAFIAQGMLAGERTLVHCNAGVSRSGAVVVEWLRRTAHLSLADAWAAARGARSVITPNSNFIAQMSALDEGGAISVGDVGAALSGGIAVHAAGAAGAPSTPTAMSILCVSGCGFHGSSATAGMCSQCFKRHTPVISSGRNLSGHTIVLLGDSTLDNVVWVHHEEGAKSVSEHLTYATSAHIVNAAADGFSSADVLHGGDAVLSRAMRTRIGDAFPLLGNAAPPPPHFAPLAVLETISSVAAAGATPHLHAVLSVGGNDVREILRDMSLLPTAIARLLDNYPRILSRILHVTRSVVIVMQYQPSLDADGVYGVYRAIDSVPIPGCDGFSAQQKLHRLLETVYEPILALARTHNLAVVDLPRSMDPRDVNLYRQQIEPSSLGGGIIATLVAHALAHHDPARGSSLYVRSPSGAVVVEANDGAAPYRVGAAVRALASPLPPTCASVP